MSKIDFKDQYKHPKWQKKRLEVLSGSGFSCDNCGISDKQLHVHHLRYKKGAEIWDYNNGELVSLCESCHKEAHEAKEEIAELIVSYGAGSEREIADLLKGYFRYTRGDGHCIENYMSVLGHGAGYLTNISSEHVINLAKINPFSLEKFIEEKSNG